jgi:hypothetical protein
VRDPRDVAESSTCAWKERSTSSVPPFEEEPSY